MAATGLLGVVLSHPAAAQADPPSRDAVLPAVRVDSTSEQPGKETLKTDTTRIGKGEQELRDVPQSMTVITERLIDDRNLDTLKDALKNTGGVTFQAAEGGEEDIRLRGFSLQSTGDIFIDGMRDPAYYDRDSFNWDRLEVLRGSASMLFGRGSTGGAANQVSKYPRLVDDSEISLTGGSFKFRRATVDLNQKLGENVAIRLNAMWNTADNQGIGIEKRGIAPTIAWGIGTRDEFSVGLYSLTNDNGIHYGLPWLTPGAGKGGDWLWPGKPGDDYYGLASDYNRTGTTQAQAVHTHRFEPGRELRTAVRIASYDRDLRASAIRFGAPTTQPSRTAVTADTFADDTVLTRGTNNKQMTLDSQTLQSDYSGRHRWGGLVHAVQAGVDLAHEEFVNYAFAVPPGTTLTKPPTNVGTPNTGTSIDEAARVATSNRAFESQAAGLYAQDLLQVAPHWKLLGGLRVDRFAGTYQNRVATVPAVQPGQAANPCNVAPLAQIDRSDTLLSHRIGALYQPTPLQSYHLSYGTSFNTSGDAYQYDAGTVNTPAEKSRNLELGAKLDSASGDFTTRFALFHSTKYNERNRDADTVDACNYVLSGERHAAGLEVDLAGRLTPAWEVFFSWSFIPVAKVDASSGAAGAEAVGSRPGLTPRNSGTLWTTYRLAQPWRIGGGLNYRGSDVPVGLAAGSQIRAPQFLTGDLMAEYTRGRLGLRATVSNVGNANYADYLYRGHYVPGRPRTFLLTLTYRL